MRFSKVILTVFCIALIPMAASAVMINEIRIDQSGADDDEYFELSGTPGESLDGLTYIVIGDGTGGSGVIENVTNLDGLMIAADGLFLVVESTWTGGCGDTPDLVGTLDFENSDNVTHMLVSDFTGAIGDDVDTDDDGIIENSPWSAVVDCLGIVETEGSGDLVYCDTTIGPDGTFVPGHVLVCEGIWIIGDFTLCVYDTPGMDNTSACVVGTEETSFGSLKSLFR
jgi:hypothetical protein